MTRTDAYADYGAIREFVRESVGFRMLGAVMVGGSIAVWIDTVMGVGLVVAGLIALFAEYAAYRTLSGADGRPPRPVLLSAATALYMCVFSLPIPMVIAEADLALTFLAAVYACVGIAYPIIGYRTRKGLMLAAMLPYVVMTGVAAYGLAQQYIAQGNPLFVWLTLVIIPAYLVVAAAIYAPLEKTAQRQAELLKAAHDERQRAEAASRAKSDFLAAMSHEMRTPMNGVVGMADLLLSTELTDAQRRYAQVISTSGDTMMVLIADILDMASLDAGDVGIENGPVDVSALVEDVALVLAGSARDKGLDLLVRIAPDLPAQSLGDAARIRQVLHKLTENAVKFTETGHVLLSVSSAGRTESGWTVEFTVSDTGIGIVPDELERMFEPFRQASQGRARLHDGLGLGLPICRDLAELMGGTLTGTSDPGTGSVFTLRLDLPTLDDRAAAAQSLHPSATVGLFGPTELCSVVMAERIAAMGAQVRHYNASLGGLLDLVGDIRKGIAPEAVIIDDRVRIDSHRSLDAMLGDLPGTVRPVLVRVCDPAHVATCARHETCIPMPVRRRDLADALTNALRQREAMRAA